MNKNEKLNFLRHFAENELNHNILPFWRTTAVDHENGGFHGEISNDLTINPKADKGLILNARLLWTFSSAYQLLQNEIDKKLAKRAFDFICQYLYDEEYKGYYWTVRYDNQPRDTKKQTYALAFTLYGMSAYLLITNDQEAVKRSAALFKVIEDHAFDMQLNGYYEAFTRDWHEIVDARLSEKDMNVKKTMNTHLHILEAYSSLYRVNQNPYLGFQLNNLVRIFLDRIITSDDFHLNLFFNEQWKNQSSHISYGHDIEAGWLIHESALALDNKNLIKETENINPKITDAALEGLSPLGGLYHESDRAGSHDDQEFEWWPQAEALVGLLNTYQLTGKEQYLDHAIGICRFIQAYVVDKEYGEWYYRIDQSGNPIHSYPKTGLWKCPYHNARACIEIIKRTEKLIEWNSK